MRIERRYTKDGQSPYADIAFRLTTSEIRNPDGSVVFRADNIEVPMAWSQVASDVLAQKYFRKAGVPARLSKVEEEGVPSFLWRSAPDDAALKELPEKERITGEHSARQVFDRLAGAWTYWGWKGGYFDSEADAQAFFDELRYMLAMQMVAPNSPQWFNTGLHWAYGIDGPSQGHFYVDFKTGKLVKSKTAYEHPQPHACFIQGIKDDLVNEGGIMDLWVREARLFKYGSGTGSNFSRLRGEGEKLSAGGRSSGLMSFLKIGDRAAGAIKSGGTTRRAAKMVIVDVDHPDIEQYINWKVLEEQKVASLVTGSWVNQKHLRAVLKACLNCEGSGDDCFDPEKNPVLRREVKAARRNRVPDSYIKRVIQFAKQGYKDIEFPIYDTDWDSEAYLTVSGQNSNNTVRVTDEFLKAVEADGDWDLTWRTKPGKVAKTVKASDLWEKIAYAAWASADPGLQYHTTINDWHTCPASGPIRASNPCSEYMFLDDTACNLASLNLLAFHGSILPSPAGGGGSGRGRWGEGRREGLSPHERISEAPSPGMGASANSDLSPHAGRGGEAILFDIDGYEHAVRLWTVVLEISVLMAQFPSREIAQLSYEYRTLGLGYANLGGLLMSSGIPYDSEAGRAICGALSAIMTGTAYATSAEMAAALGAFPGYKKNREPMLRVMRNHRRAAHGEKTGYETLASPPVRLDHAACPDARLIERARLAWDRALALGEQHGYRNAQATVIAPTGTIGLVMDCDTTGIEPDFALVKFKKLAGGGYFKIINRAVPEALRVLGYSDSQHRRHRDLCGRPRHARQFARHQSRRAEGEGLYARGARAAGEGAADRLRHPLRLQQMDARRGVLHRHARARRRGPRQALVRHAGGARLLAARDRRDECACVRGDDGRGRAASARRALCRVRLRQSVRAQRQALPLGRQPYPHDGGGAALRLRRDLQDHQHAERRDGGGLQAGLSALLEARAEGERALSRRLEAVAAAAEPAHLRRR